MTRSMTRLLATLAATTVAAGTIAVAGPASTAQAANSYHRVYASPAACRALVFGDAERLRASGYTVTVSQCSKRVNSSITDGYLKWR